MSKQYSNESSSTYDILKHVPEIDLVTMSKYIYTRRLWN